MDVAMSEVLDGIPLSEPDAQMERLPASDMQQTAVSHDIQAKSGPASPVQNKASSVLHIDSSRPEIELGLPHTESDVPQEVTPDCKVEASSSASTQAAFDEERISQANGILYRKSHLLIFQNWKNRPWTT